MAEPHDVRGHFPYHEYPHPNDHTHAAVAEPLTPDMAVLDAARAFVHAWETGVDTTDEYAALLDAARAAAPLDVEDLIRRLQAPPYHWNERITHDLRAVAEDARRG